MAKPGKGMSLSRQYRPLPEAEPPQFEVDERNYASAMLDGNWDESLLHCIMEKQLRGPEAERGTGRHSGDLVFQ